MKMNSRFMSSDVDAAPGSSNKEVNKVFSINSVEQSEYRHTGWKMTFANGCTISVQFGTGTYSDQGHLTAEVAAWNAEGNWMIRYDGMWHTLSPDDSDVMGNCTPDEIAVMMRELIDIK